MIPWIGLLAALGIGLLVHAIGHKALRRHQPGASATGPRGFAGWLLLLAAVQLAACLAVLVDFLRNLQIEPRPAAFALRLLLLALVLASSVLMLRRSRHFPSVLRFELVAAVLYPIFAVSVLAGDARVFVTEPKLWLAVALKVAVTGIVAALASLYAQHSRRVRATFVA